MTVTVPLALLREQIPTIVTSFGVGLRSMTPLTRPRSTPDPAPVLREERAAPSARLVDSYVAWCGAPAGRYHDSLPPHFCSHYAFSMLARLGGQVSYSVASILNQGLALKIKSALPRDVPLVLRGQLQGVEDDGKRIRIHSQVIAGTAAQPESMVIDSYSAIPKRGPKDKKIPEPRVEPAWQTIGEWSVAADDGVNFALLTGDFNPLHTLPAVARRTPHRGCILHGFGSVARTWEALRNAGHDIAELDLRWIRPIPLPSSGLQVQVAPQDRAGRFPFRLHGNEGAVHLAGHFISP